MNAILVPELTRSTEESPKQAEDLRKQLIRELDRLKLLLAINNAVVSNLALPQLFRAIPAAVRSAMQCDVTCLSLPEGHILRIHGLDFPQGKGFMREEMALPMEESAAGRAFRTGKAVVVRTPLGLRDTAAFRLNSDEGFQSACFIPIVRRNRILGVLHLLDRHQHAFNDGDVEFLNQMASQIAIALENGLEYRQLSVSRERLAEELSLHRRNYSGASTTLANAEREHILQMLRESGWVLGGENGAAKRLGVPRTTLIYKMRRLGIARPPD